MTVRCVLWTYKPRKDGSCNIKLYINTEEGKQYKATKYYAKPGDWDNKLGRFKRTAANCRSFNIALEKEENKFIGKLLGAGDSLIEFIDNHIEECKAGVYQLSFNTWRQYITHVGKLRNFALSRGREDIGFTDIDFQFYTDFITHLKQRGLGDPGISKQIKHLRKFLRLAYDREMHSNRIFESPQFKNIKYKPSPKIYLDEQEISLIEGLDCSDDLSLMREQDRFMVSYFLLLRYGDSIKIRKKQFFSRGEQLFYRCEAEKTGSISIVPVNSKALAVLKRRDFDLSGDANQESNRKLKTIAAMAGINTDFEGKPKWKYITTHTARRSAATNLFLQGVPLNELMQLGGWKSESVLRQYLLASGIELAMSSAQRDFFQ